MAQFVDYANLAQFYAGLKERFAPKGHGGGGGGEYTDATQLPGESWEKLFAAMDSGERCSGYGKALAIGYDGSLKDVRRAKQYEHKLTKQAIYLRDITIRPSGVFPVMLQFLCENAGTEILFENVTFDNMMIVPYDSNFKTLAFKNCRFLNGQYNALRIQKTGIHIILEDCVFEHFYPDYDEYRADIVPRSLVGWAYQPIIIRSSGVQMTVKRTSFKDIMALAVIKFSNDYASDKSAGGLYATFEDCVFED
ncbi:MAG: hypothetical protein PHY12_12285, partial [Eubacteriales bacterium]|nr:hypothetical protein [Eubacteriales bacterium]